MPKPQSEFYTPRVGVCKGCKRAYVAAWQKENRAQSTGNKKAWQLRNPDKMKAARASWNNSEEGRRRKREWMSLNQEKSKELKRLWNAKTSNQEKMRESRRRWNRLNKGAKAALTKAYKMAKLRAMPTWSDKAAIRKVYEKAAELGFVVDHIVPVKHPNVSGLHVPANLQLLQATLNLVKGNRYWPDMPE